MKVPSPSMPWIIAGNVCACAGFGALAYFSYPSFIAMFDAFAMGLNFAAVGYMVLLGRAIRQVRVLGEVCHEMAKANMQLIAELMSSKFTPIAPPIAGDFDNDHPKYH